jgi:hypothetical protein
MLVLLALGVFASAVSIEVASVRHQLAVAAGDPWRAGGWALAWYAAGAIGFVAAAGVTWWMLAPEGIGFFVGSWTAVRFAGGRARP